MNNIVNLAIVLFCFFSVAKMVVNFMRADPDERVAIMVIFGLMIVLVVGHGIYIMYTSVDKNMDMWIEVFLAIVFGLLAHQVYRELKKIIRYPSRIFAVSIVGLVMVSTIMDLIF